MHVRPPTLGSPSLSLPKLRASAPSLIRRAVPAVANVVSDGASCAPAAAMTVLLVFVDSAHHAHSAAWPAHACHVDRYSLQRRIEQRMRTSMHPGRAPQYEYDE